MAELAHPQVNFSFSPLMLADRLLTLAQDADRAGLVKPAERLLQLAYAVYREGPPKRGLIF